MRGGRPGLLRKVQADGDIGLSGHGQIDGSLRITMPGPTVQFGLPPNVRVAVRGRQNPGIGVAQRNVRRAHHHRRRAERILQPDAYPRTAQAGVDDHPHGLIVEPVQRNRPHRGVAAARLCRGRPRRLANQRLRRGPRGHPATLAGRLSIQQARRRNTRQKQNENRTNLQSWSPEEILSDPKAAARYSKISLSVRPIDPLGYSTLESLPA